MISPFRPWGIAAILFGVASLLSFVCALNPWLPFLTGTGALGWCFAFACLAGVSLAATAVPTIRELLTVSLGGLRQVGELLIARTWSARFWLVATAFYFTLVFNVSWQWVGGHEPGLVADTISQDQRSLGAMHWTPARETPAEVNGLIGATTYTLGEDTIWKLSSEHDDESYYLRQIYSVRDSIPPFRYRILPTALVRVWMIAVGEDPLTAFRALNACALLAAALFFALFLSREYGVRDPVAFLGGVAVITSAVAVRTAAFPLTDPLSLALTVPLFWTVKRRSSLWFSLVSVMAILTREMFILASLMWVVEQLAAREKLVLCYLPAVVPVLAFAAARIALGGHALEVSYGFNAGAGHIPSIYLNRFHQRGGMEDFLWRAFEAFGAAWVGVLFVKLDPFSRRHLYLIPLTLVAIAALSGQVLRPMGQLFPLLFTPLLLALDRRALTDSQSRSTYSG